MVDFLGVVGNFPGWGRDGNAGWACKEGAASGAVTGAGASSVPLQLWLWSLTARLKSRGRKTRVLALGLFL